MQRNAILLASIVVAALAAGCGKHADTQALGGTATTQPAGFEPTGEVTRTLPDSARAEGGAPAGSGGTLSADSLPPDLSVSAPDSLLMPGVAVEIIARGTPDVIEVSLWDGIGKKQPMTYDSEGKVWKAFYRVPLRFSAERVALSVTAKNGANKWRRVWVNLQIQGERTESKPEAVSGS